MRLKAYAGHIKDRQFREVARLDLGKRKHAGYVYDWYLHPVGVAVVLHTEHGDPIFEDRLGNNLRALPVLPFMRAMKDDNKELPVGQPRWTWELDVLASPNVSHVILTVW